MFKGFRSWVERRKLLKRVRVDYVDDRAIFYISVDDLDNDGGADITIKIMGMLSEFGTLSDRKFREKVFKRSGLHKVVSKRVIEGSYNADARVNLNETIRERSVEKDKK